MSETTNLKAHEAVLNEDKENISEGAEKGAEPVKPYKLRELCAEDVFPMLTIVKKIGIKEFKECFSKETLESIVDLFMNGAKTANKEGENKDSEDNTLVAVGISILPSVLDVADVLIGNIAKCETDFYKFLANISDLSVDEIKKLNMADFFEMIVDVVKKEEFKDFFKVVSKLFK